MNLCALSMRELRLRLQVARAAQRKAVDENTLAGKVEADRQVKVLEVAIRDKERQIEAARPSAQTINMNPLSLAGGSERIRSNAARPGTPQSSVSRVVESRGIVRFICACGCEVTLRFDTGHLGQMTCACGRQYGAQALVTTKNEGRIVRG